MKDDFSLSDLFIPFTPKKAIIFIILIGFFVFFNSLFNGFIWDDESYITKNIYIQQFNVTKIFTSNIDAGQGFESNYYRPLTSVTFAIDTFIWKQNAFGFHLTNLNFHILSTIMLFFLLSGLGIGRMLSFIIGLIFLIHPVQTEAVTYISSRGDSLYAFFLFFGLYCLLQGIRKGSLGYFFFCIFSFLASILSKETSIATIFLFPLIFFMEYLQKKQSLRLFIKKQKKAFFFLCSIGAVALSYVTMRLTILNFANTLNFYTTLSNLTPLQQLYAHDLSIRLFTFTKVLWTYIGILLFPYQLHMYRTITYVTSFLSPWVLTSLVLVSLVIFLAIYEIYRYRKAYILFGFMLAATTLFPVSGIIPINWILFEHWLYVPLVGFFLIVFRTCQIFVPQLTSNKSIKNVFIFFCVTILGLYAILTIYQNSLWSDPIRFYTYTLQFTETAPINNNLGMSYAEKGQSKEAIYYYKKALRIQTYPQTYYNLGIEYKLLGEYALAEKAFNETLVLNPRFSLAKDNLIIIYLRTGRYEKALELSNNNPQIEAVINQLKAQKK